MRPVIIDAKGQIIVNALRTGEVSIQIASSGGTLGSILTPKEAAQLSCALVVAIKEARG